MKRIILGDNAEVLPTLEESFARAIYIDPPFNTPLRPNAAACVDHERRGEHDRPSGGILGRRSRARP